MRSMLVILALAATSGGAQTVVKQGEIPKQFRSPMVIVTPLLVAGFVPFYKNLGWIESKPEVREYICDNVSIASLSMKLKDGKDGMTELALQVMLKNGYGHDKLVSLEFEVMNGEEGVATFRISRIEAEEQKTSNARVGKVVLPRAKLIKEPMTKLRITMTVMDD